VSRTLACLAVLLLVVPTALAQPQAGDPIPLTISPAAVPSPSLKYRLLPDRRELVPGNAAALYYRTEALFYENGDLLQDVMGGPWSTWANMPLKQLPLKDMGLRLATVRHLMDELDTAALRRECDWHLENRPEGVGLLLPDVQSFRAFAAVLAARARYHIARGEFAEALQALQTGYALGHHMTRGPTLIHVLVGLAIANIMNAQLDELVQQPEAPNLYWALAVLPRPFADLQIALQEEGTMVERTLPFLKRLDAGPMTQEEVRAAEKKIDETFKTFGLRPANPADILVHVWTQVETYALAKKALVAQGLSAEQVDAMPPFQVMGLYAYREYRVAWEEYIKWLALPGGVREPGFKEAAKKYREASARLDRLFFRGLLGGFADTAFEKVFQAVGRTDRRFAALRCVEAVRLYAAAHGKLPKALQDITDVPIPDDPITGKPFEYSADGDKAKLVAPPPGEKPPPYMLLTYELTLRR
jgi:hypothetical protein